MALRSRQPPVPAKVRAAVVGVHSAGVGQEGAEERLVPRGGAALAPAAAAGVRSKLGGERPAARGWREEGQRARAAETRSRGSPPRPGRGAAPTSRARAAAGTCAVAADSPGSGAAGAAGAREEGRRKGVSRDRAAPPPGTRRLYSPGQGWGEAVLSSGASRRRLPPPPGRRALAAGPFSCSSLLILSSPKV